EKLGEEDGGSTEKGEEEGRVDLLAGHCQEHGVKTHGDGDGTVVSVENHQRDFPDVPVNILEAKKDKRVQIDVTP
ncbi:hypothetical protein A2U01_0102176, partial [Trifolium medium]|nr:hypothetical protein [Trifolium medium]